MNLPQVMSKNDIRKMMNESLYSNVTDSDIASSPEAKQFQNYEARFASQDFEATEFLKQDSSVLGHEGHLRNEGSGYIHV